MLIELVFVFLLIFKIKLQCFFLKKKIITNIVEDVARLVSLYTIDENININI